jgi:vancomycin permeability regulator SanA
MSTVPANTKPRLFRTVVLVVVAVALLIAAWLGVENWIVSQRLATTLQLQKGMTQTEVEQRLGTDRMGDPWRDEQGNQRYKYRVDFRALVASRGRLVEVSFDPDGKLAQWSE